MVLSGTIVGQDPCGPDTTPRLKGLKTIKVPTNISFRGSTGQWSGPKIPYDVLYGRKHSLRLFPVPIPAVNPVNMKAFSRFGKRKVVTPWTGSNPNYVPPEHQLFP